MLNQHFTERAVQVLRSYLTSKIPIVKGIQKSKHEFLSNMPSLFVLYKNFSTWTFHSVKQLRISLLNSRDIECIRMSVKTAMENYWKALNNVGCWPYPPLCGAVPEEKQYRTVICLVNIDSGTGATMVIFWFLRDGGSQHVKEVLLAAHAHGSKKSFQFFSKVFSEVAQEICHLPLVFSKQNLPDQRKTPKYIPTRFTYQNWSG